MKKNEALKKLNKLITELEHLPKYEHGSKNKEFKFWIERANRHIKKIFTNKEHFAKFKRITFEPRLSALELVEEKNLGAKKNCNELMIDPQRYLAHPDWDQLICFVYDSEGYIVNPRGLEDDL